MVECDGAGNLDELQAWLDNNGGAEASDICSGVVWSNDYDPANFVDLCGATGYVDVVFTATDDCGNDSETSARFTIEDTTPPVITVPGGIELCNDDFPEILTAEYADACSGSGTVTATGSNFVQGECVQYMDYVFTATDDCGNTATETFTVERYYDEYDNCETAFGFDSEVSDCFIDQGFDRWGWSNYYTEEGVYTLDLYAGAAQCDTSNGVNVGTVTIDYTDGQVTVTYNMFEGYVMTEAHLYIGCDRFPLLDTGEITVAPGQYTFNAGILDHVQGIQFGPFDATGPIFVIAHAVTCEVICRCSPYEEIGIINPENDGFDCAPEETVDNETEALDFRAYPVPFDQEVFINYNFDYNTDVVVEVYDLKGTLVRRVVDDSYSSGMNSTVKLDLSDADNQMYFVRLTTNKGSITKKIISN